MWTGKKYLFALPVLLFFLASVGGQEQEPPGLMLQRRLTDLKELLTLTQSQLDESRKKIESLKQELTEASNSQEALSKALTVQVTALNQQSESLTNLSNIWKETESYYQGIELQRNLGLIGNAVLGGLLIYSFAQK